MPLGDTLIGAVKVGDNAIAHQAKDAFHPIVRAKTFPLVKIVNRAAIAAGNIKNQPCRRCGDLDFIGVEFFFLSSPRAVLRHRWDVVSPALHHRQQPR